ncbi:hypothetical protein ABIB54_003016 [Frigoribacterium sp. UYMn621]
MGPILLEPPRVNRHNQSPRLAETAVSAGWAPTKGQLSPGMLPHARPRPGQPPPRATSPRRRPPRVNRHKRSPRLAETAVSDGWALTLPQPPRANRHNRSPRLAERTVSDGWAPTKGQPSPGMLPRARPRLGQPPQRATSPRRRPPRANRHKRSPRLAERTVSDGWAPPSAGRPASTVTTGRPGWPRQQFLPGGPQPRGSPYRGWGCFPALDRASATSPARDQSPPSPTPR